MASLFRYLALIIQTLDKIVTRTFLSASKMPIFNAQLLKQKIINFWRYHYFPALYYIPHILQHRISFKSPSRSVYETLNVTKPVAHVYFPVLWCSMHVTRAGLSIFSTSLSERIWTGNVLLPWRDAKQIEFTVIIWSTMAILWGVAVIPSKSKNLEFLAPLALNCSSHSPTKSVPIGSKQLRLSESVANRIVSVRDKLIKFYLISTTNSTILSSIATVIQSSLLMSRMTFLERCLTAFWNFSFFVWVPYANFGGYGMHTVIILILYTLIQKQKPSAVSRLTNRRTWHQNALEHSLYMREIHSSSASINRALTAMIMPYVMLLSYIIYLSFLTNMAEQFKLIYTAVFFVYLLTIIVVFYLCSKIYDYNLKYAKNYRRFLFLDRFRVMNKEASQNSNGTIRLWNLKYLHKMDTVIQSLTGFASGFLLETGTVLDTTTCGRFFYSVSLYFFLAFKKS